MRTSLPPVIAVVMALDAAAAAAPGEFSDRWQTLYPTPGQTPLEPAGGVTLVGPHEGHPFYLGSYAPGGEWRVDEGLLVPAGADAMTLGTAQSFEIEGVADASGTGGLIILVGYDGADGGRGFGLWNATMRTSGSPWELFRFEGGVAVEDSAVELPMLQWKGQQPFRLSVRDAKLTLQIGPQVVVSDHPLDGYEGGQIILGTYDTKYGPRRLKIKALRARSL